MALRDVGPGLSWEPDVSARSLQWVLPPLGNGGHLGTGLLLEGVKGLLSPLVPGPSLLPGTVQCLYLLGPSRNVSAR